MPAPADPPLLDPPLLDPPLLDTDADGTARVAGTRIKVRLLAEWWREGELPIPEVREQYPGLTAEQVAAALDHYRAHRAAMDADIEADRTAVERDRAAAGYSPALRRLYEQGRLPARYAPPARCRCGSIWITACRGPWLRV